MTLVSRTDPPTAPIRTGRRCVALLAGSAEAREVARLLVARPDIELSVSLARPERVPFDFGAPTRIGRFGGPEGLARWLRQAGTDAVIDATHPFAARISWRAAEVCRALAIPVLQVLRPGWIAAPEDRWSWVDGAAEAAGLIPAGATVLATTGRETYRDLAALTAQTVHIRSLGESGAPFPCRSGRFLFAEGPFTAEVEERLLRGLGVDWLIVRDAGGAGGWPKLEAARRLGLSVVMIRRPPQPPVPRVAAADAVPGWLEALA